MATCNAALIDFLGVFDLEGNSWDGGTDFGLLDCCEPLTLEFRYHNHTGRKIRIDGEDVDFPEPIPGVNDSGDGFIGILSVNNFTAGWILSEDTFSIFVTIDPSKADCTLTGELLDTFTFYVCYDQTDGAANPCSASKDFHAIINSCLAPSIDLGSQGNLDGFCQFTTNIGTPLSKTIQITNNDSVSRDYSIAQPACWAGRFSTDQADLFTGFSIASGDVKVVEITYDPTVEEIDCCEFEITDSCENLYTFNICFEAVSPEPIIDDGGSGGGGGSGGLPPCEGFINCDLKSLADEQIIRRIILKDENGCPAINIILT